MRRRIKLKITKVREQTITLPQTATRANCPVCQREVWWLTTIQAAEVLEIDENALHRLLTSDQIHALRMVSGSLRVCKDSLFTQAKEKSS